MASSKFVCFNGEFIKSDNASINCNNRAFLYGDGLFETIHVCNNEVQFLDEHLRRLRYGMKVLHLESSTRLIKNKIQDKITRLLNTNKIFGGARIRLTVFRQGEGLYTPESNETGYLIDSSPLTSEKYVLNNKGLVIDIFPDLVKPINTLSNLKTINALPFVLAGVYKNYKKIDDCIILNSKTNAAECISSNLFIVKNMNIYTPALSEGCVAGIMRKAIIQIAKSLNINVYDNGCLKPEDLLLADEIFLSNAISGIRWVVGYRNKRYYNRLSRELVNELNKLAFKK